jgi:hypothetical protein
MKYVRHVRLGVILFDSDVRHVDVVKELGGRLHEIRSAGHVFMASPPDVTVGGESMTLDLKPGVTDSQLIKHVMRVGI